MEIVHTGLCGTAAQPASFGVMSLFLCGIHFPPLKLSPKQVPNKIDNVMNKKIWQVCPKKLSLEG